MKLICTQENLKNGLASASRIISSTNTLPILNNLLLKTENGQLKISSTNLELAVNSHVRCKIENEGQTTVVAKMLNELVNNLPNENLTLTTEDGNLLIRTENQQYKIKTLPAEEFPFIPELGSNVLTSLEGEELKNSLNKVIFAASTNQTQPEIAGVYMGLGEGVLKLVATDRYRLAEKTVSCQGSAEVILPHRTALEMVRILGGGNEKVELGILENQVFVKVGQTQLISRLVDGQYPDYKSIIPENFNTVMVADRAKLQSAVKTSALFSQNTNSIKLEFSSEKQSIVISSESQDLGSGVAEVPAKVEGVSGSLLLNYKYMLDFFSQAEGEKVEVKVVNDSSAAVFAVEGQKDYLYLVMPIKT